MLRLFASLQAEGLPTNRTRSLLRLIFQQEVSVDESQGGGNQLDKLVNVVLIASRPVISWSPGCIISAREWKLIDSHTQGVAEGIVQGEHSSDCFGTLVSFFVKA
ncbi:MAG: hypothetical protein AUJ07_08235 [Crenarchaeota archaeon 13_1_40CM_3_53_5]|nr:MAG: hypothetical protein AUJ07_08235 [Crenarchaeota archaeon 13_1_40CM_3_53_5]